MLRAEAHSAGCSGGLARIKAAIDDARGGGIPVIVLNAGDDLKGTPWDRLSINGTSIMARLMRQLSISAMVRIRCHVGRYCARDIFVVVVVVVLQETVTNYVQSMLCFQQYLHPAVIY